MENKNGSNYETSPQLPHHGPLPCRVVRAAERPRGHHLDRPDQYLRQQRRFRPDSGHQSGPAHGRRLDHPRHFQGIYNAATEAGFTHFFSPQNTAWSDGTLANYASLTYVDWDTWAKVQHVARPVPSGSTPSFTLFRTTFT